MAKAPNPAAVSAAARREDQRKRADRVNGLAVTVWVGDTAHVFRFGDLTALDADALRAEVGWGLAEVLRLEPGSLDIHGVSVVCWLAMRQAGARATKWVDVAETFKLGGEWSWHLGEPAEDDPGVEEDPTGPLAAASEMSSPS